MLLDLDHTLLDSAASEDAAFAGALRVAGVAEADGLRAHYDRINLRLWSAVERHELTPDQVRYARFEELVDTAGLRVDAGLMADAFTDGLAAEGELYPGARAVLGELAGSATLALVTNGLSDVQRGRIRRLGLERYFRAIVISAEVGTAKPAPELFDLVFDSLGAPPRQGALMVGDSLSSDVAGGIAAGIDTCWYNPGGAPVSSGIVPTYRIGRLEQLPDLVRSGAVRG